MLHFPWFSLSTSFHAFFPLALTAGLFQLFCDLFFFSNFYSIPRSLVQHVVEKSMPTLLNSSTGYLTWRTKWTSNIVGFFFWGHWYRKMRLIILCNIIPFVINHITSYIQFILIIYIYISRMRLQYISNWYPKILASFIYSIIQWLCFHHAFSTFKIVGSMDIKLSF